MRICEVKTVQKLTQTFRVDIEKVMVGNRYNVYKKTAKWNIQLSGF